MAEYHIRWDPTNKKWEVSVDAGAFVDLVENPTIEVITANGITAPAGVASKGLLYYDSTLNRFRFRENAGAADAWCRENSYPAGGLDIAGLTELTNTPDQDADFFIIHGGSGGVRNKMLPRYLSGNQPKVFVFSSGQFFGTTDTNLTSFDHTFNAGDLEVGDTIQIVAQAFLGGTTAGTKSLTLALGAGAARTIFSSTGIINNTSYHIRLECIVRSLTTVAIVGFTVIAISGSGFTETYTVAQGWTVSNLGTNSALLRWVGKHTGSAAECRLTDVVIRVFRAGGNAVVV